MTSAAAPTVPPYPGLAHLWALLCCVLPPALVLAGWWTFGDFSRPPDCAGLRCDPTLRGVWRLVEVFLFTSTTALVAQGVVPVLAAVRGLRRHPFGLGLLAAVLSAVPVVGFGTGTF